MSLGGVRESLSETESLREALHDLLLCCPTWHPELPRKQVGCLSNGLHKSLKKGTCVRGSSDIKSWARAHACAAPLT